MNHKLRESLATIMDGLIKSVLCDKDLDLDKYISEILEAIANWAAPMRDSTHLILSMLDSSLFFTNEAIEEIIKKCNKILGDRKLRDAIYKPDKVAGEHIDITTEEEKKRGITGHITFGSDTIIDNKTGLPQGLDHEHFRKILQDKNKKNMAIESIIFMGD